MNRLWFVPASRCLYRRSVSVQPGLQQSASGILPPYLRPRRACELSRRPASPVHDGVGCSRRKRSDSALPPPHRSPHRPVLRQPQAVDRQTIQSRRHPSVVPLPASDADHWHITARRTAEPEHRHRQRPHLPLFARKKFVCESAGLSYDRWPQAANVRTAQTADCHWRKVTLRRKVVTPGILLADIVLLQTTVPSAAFTANR